MKIIAISDTHGELIKINKCDILCICGDFVPLHCQRNLAETDTWLRTKFASWIDDLPCDKVIITPGNHDFYFDIGWESKEQTFDDIFEGKVVVLKNKEYIYKGYKFYGTPNVKAINGHWAFETAETVYMPQDDVFFFPLLDTYGRIPRDVDFILSHDTPFKNASLALAIKDLNYKYMFVGHWHTWNKDLNDMSKIKNVSILDDYYTIHYNPTEVEVEDKEDELPTEA